ncbi:MAG: tyrosine-type recombinase/integrase [Alphaproteobacteria bacterium]
MARQWWEFQKDLWTPKHADRVWKRLADNAFAHLDQKPMAEIERADVVAVIRRIEERGALDVAKRVFQTIKAVFSYSVDIGLLQHDTISDMRSIVKHRKVQHRASMPNEMLGSFLAGLTINPDHPIGAGQKQAI